METGVVRSKGKSQHFGTKDKNVDDSASEKDKC